MSGPKTTTSSQSTSNTKSKTKSKSQLSPWEPAAEEVQQIPEYASTAYGQAQPYLGTGLGSLDTFQQGLFGGGGFGQGAQYLGDAAGMLGQGQGMIDQSKGLFGDTFGKVSGYLDPIASGSMIGQDNPYLQDMLTQIQDTIRNDVGGQFARAGRSFSGAHANTLGKGMSAGLAAPLFSNYWNERNAQMAGIGGLQNAGYGAAQGIGGLTNNLGNLAQGYGNLSSQYDAIAANKNQAGLQGAGIQTLLQTLPYTSAQNYANLLMPAATAFGEQKQKSKSKGTTINVGTGTSSVNDGGASTAGMIIGGLGLLSDRRAKEDIEPIGKLNDGQIVYRFRYKGDDITQIGLMADEVEKVRPEAVYTGRNGLKLVDYKLATDGAAL